MGGRRASATGRWIAVVLLAGLAVATLAVQPWTGPVLLVFSSYHGIDLSDLVPAGFAAACGLVLVDVLSDHPVGNLARQARRRARPMRRPLAVVAGLALGGAAVVRMEESVQPRSVETAVTLAVLAVVAAWIAVTVDRDLVVAGVVLAVGFVVDAVAVPSGTLFGPMFLAVFLARREVRTGNHLGAGALALAVVAFAALSAASLFDVAGLDVRMAGSDGGPARTGALGIVLVLHGALGTPTGSRSTTAEPGG